MAWNGPKLSRIGYGALKIGRNQGVRYRETYDLPDEKAVDRLLNGVLDLGINLIDTAPAYGLSEERIGRSISHRRDEFVLSTKAGESFEDDRSIHDFSRQTIMDSVQRSLRRLRTDYLDLVLIHSNRDDLQVATQTDAPEALLQLRDEGTIGAVGFSGYTEPAFRAAMEWSDALMVEYNLEHRALEPVMAEASRRGIAVLVKKGLGSGRLDVEQSIRFVLSNPAVSSLVVGSLSLEHLREAVRLGVR